MYLCIIHMHIVDTCAVDWRHSEWHWNCIGTNIWCDTDVFGGNMVLDEGNSWRNCTNHPHDVQSICKCIYLLFDAQNSLVSYLDLSCPSNCSHLEVWLHNWTTFLFLSILFANSIADSFLLIQFWCYSKLSTVFP